MLLTIVRHGETIANEEDNIQGQLPGKLSKAGWLQANALAIELKSSSFDFLISTDLKRGLDTAKVIAQHLKVSLITDPLLRERSFGKFEGTSRSAFYSYERSLPNPYSNRPENGESFDDLHKRAEMFLNKIKNNYNKKSLLILSHGDFIRMFLGVFQGLPVEKASKIKQANGCINILRIAKNEHRVIKLNDIQYLDPESISTNKSEI